jgi:hypothetical protein
VTICRLSGLRATEACKHGWPDLGYVQAGLTALPGSADASASARAAAPRSTVYDDYFPYGTAPTDACDKHGVPGIPGINGAGETQTSGGAALVSASYMTEGSSSRLQKVVGADGRPVWVVR